MRLALLYSGGKDSTLAALLLDRFYDVTLVTAHFGVTGDHRHAAETAGLLGLPFETVALDRAVAEDAVERMVSDGFPRNGIQHVHTHALETVAGIGERAAGLDVPEGGVALPSFDAVADGTRRDDRVPTVSRAQAQSLEDRYGVDYIAPLSGFGRGAVDDLVGATLDVESGPSEQVPKADYETELRALLAETRDETAVRDVFPAHTQTRVTGVRGAGR